MTTRRVVTFNVNQFSPIKHQKADLRVRMQDADVVLLQETVNFDLVAFAAHHKGWAAYQVRKDANDGHANTAVLYRTSVGTVTETECVLIGDAADTRRRFLTAVEFDHWDWTGSLHIFPRRDTKDIPAELASVGAWVKSKGDVPIVLGLDKNQATVAALEKATGLTWHGVDIDGFLANVPVADVAAFKPGFSDHPGVHGVATIPAKPKAPAKKPTHRGEVAPPSPPYVGPAAHTSVGQNQPIVRITMHSTVSPCVPGGARSIARYFRSEASGGSAQYVVDPGEVVQVVYDNVIAWHAPGSAWSADSHPEPANIHSIGIEMCDIPGPVPNDKPGTALFKAAVRSWRWRKPEQKQMLARAAKLAARLCAAYHVPPNYVGKRGLLKGAHGITTHNNVSQDFRLSTHWDPGFWPRRRFMRMVKAEYRRLTK